MTSLLFTLCFSLKNNAKTIDYININKESDRFIRKLNFIGPKMAQNIVKYRQSLPNNKFNSIEEFRNMPGIKDIMIRSNKDRIVL